MLRFPERSTFERFDGFEALHGSNFAIHTPRGLKETVFISSAHGPQFSSEPLECRWWCAADPD